RKVSDVQLLGHKGLLRENHAIAARPTAGCRRRARKLPLTCDREEEKGRWKDNEEVVTARNTALPAARATSLYTVAPFCTTRRLIWVSLRKTATITVLSFPGAFHVP